MKGFRVTLSEEEMFMGAYIGVNRRITGITRKLTGLAKQEPSFNADCGGAIGEVAVGSLFYYYVDPRPQYINGEKRPDFKPDIEVRWTSYATGKLVIRPWDLMDRRFLLVVGKPPYLRVVGYYQPSSMKLQPDWFEGPNNRDEAHWVPQEFLIDVKEMREFKRVHRNG